MLNLKTEVMVYETNCTEITQDKWRELMKYGRKLSDACSENQAGIAGIIPCAGSPVL